MVYSFFSFFWFFSWFFYNKKRVFYFVCVCMPVYMCVGLLGACCSFVWGLGFGGALGFLSCSCSNFLFVVCIGLNKKALALDRPECELFHGNCRFRLTRNRFMGGRGKREEER